MIAIETTSSRVLQATRARGSQPRRIWPSGLAASVEGERGMALLTALMVMILIFALGTFAVISSRSEIRAGANYGARLQSQYFAESGIDQLIGYQNDTSRNPRFLFDSANYTSMSADSSVLKDLDAIDPATKKKIGTIHRVVLADPTVEPPPYTVLSTATMFDGSQATYQVDVYTKSLLDYAFYSEASLSFCPPSTILGRVYTAGSFSLSGTSPCSGISTFGKRVEYVGSISGTSYGDFREGYYQVPANPTLASLVDLGYYKNAVQTAGVCGTGKGLYIGNSGATSTQQQSSNLFQMNDIRTPGVDDLTSSTQWSQAKDIAVTGCMTTANANSWCYQIDLTLFDFTADPITYGGKSLVDWNGSSLRPGNFNGVIYVEGELHVWGILGGRSPEDRVTRDSVTTYDGTIYRPTSYPSGSTNPNTAAVGSSPRGKPFHHHPNFANLAAPWNALVGNLYSNNVLDPGEDTNANGILDPAGRGRSLTIVTRKDDDIIVDHNIYYGTDALGTRPSLSLISGDLIHIDPNSPRAQLATGSKLATDSELYSGVTPAISFIPMPTSYSNTHRLNFWAKRAGDMTPSDSSYVFDLDGDEVLEANNGMGQTGDGTETAMRASWSVYDLGNIVTAGGITYGYWSSGARARMFAYDTDLMISEPPCQPVQSYYGTISGSFTEVRN